MEQLQLDLASIEDLEKEINKLKIELVATKMKIQMLETDLQNAVKYLRYNPYPPNWYPPNWYGPIDITCKQYTGAGAIN